MIVFLDENYICHAENSGNLVAVDVDHFDGKCPTYINGYRYIPDGHSWTAPDGTVYRGEMLSPWKPWDGLDAAQREYERQYLSNLETENETLMNDMAQMVEEVYQSDVEILGI